MLFRSDPGIKVIPVKSDNKSQAPQVPDTSSSFGHLFISAAYLIVGLQSKLTRIIFHGTGIKRRITSASNELIYWHVNESCTRLLKLKANINSHLAKGERVPQLGLNNSSSVMH